MSRKAGQIIARGRCTWLLRVFLGRDRDTGTRKYRNRTVHGSVQDAQTCLNQILQERDLNRFSPSSTITLNPYLNQWLETAAKLRLRPKSFTDYEALLRLHVRPALGSKLLALIEPLDIQAVYRGMIDHGLSPRTVHYTHTVLQS
jgi:integrase